MRRDEPRPFRGARACNPKSGRQRQLSRLQAVPGVRYGRFVAATVQPLFTAASTESAEAELSIIEAGPGKTVGNFYSNPTPIFRSPHQVYDYM